MENGICCVDANRTGQTMVSLHILFSLERYVDFSHIVIKEL